jgi:hypothetical protein
MKAKEHNSKLIADLMSEITPEEQERVTQEMLNMKEEQLTLETRPCHTCKNYKRLPGGSICQKKLMAVVPDMLVSFYPSKGTCFEEPSASSEIL